MGARVTANSELARVMSCADEPAPWARSGGASLREETRNMEAHRRDAACKHYDQCRTMAESRARTKRKKIINKPKVWVTGTSNSIRNRDDWDDVAPLLFDSSIPPRRSLPSDTKVNCVKFERAAESLRLDFVWLLRLCWTKNAPFEQ